jgi:hypothetical protein
MREINQFQQEDKIKGNGKGKHETLVLLPHTHSHTKNNSECLSKKE